MKQFINRNFFQVIFERISNVICNSILHPSLLTYTFIHSYILHTYIQVSFSISSYKLPSVYKKIMNNLTKSR